MISLRLLPSISLAFVLLLVVAFAGIANAGSPLVLCLGDSLTEGYQVEPEAAFPALLQAALRERGWLEAEVINAGISGSTSAGAVSRLRWQLRRRPDVLVLALGANDGLRGVDPASTKNNLSDAIDLALSEGIKVLLAGMKLPPNYGAEHTAAFEAVFTELAEEKQVALLPFLLRCVAARPELNLAEGIHPNAKGYPVVANTVIEHLEPLLPPQASVATTDPRTDTATAHAQTAQEEPTE